MRTEFAIEDRHRLIEQERPTAERFQFTQPTLTKIVYYIEPQAGVQIFERTTPSVGLLRDGEEIVPAGPGLRKRQQPTRRHRSPRAAITVAPLPTCAALLLPHRMPREVCPQPARGHPCKKQG